MAEVLTIQHGLPLKVRPERFVVVTDVGESGDNFTAAALHKGKDGAYLDEPTPIHARDVIRPIGGPFSPAEVLELITRGATIQGTKLSDTSRELLAQSAAKGPRTIITHR